MQVIGFGFEKIQAERKNLTKQGNQNININSNINIKNISQEQIDVVKDKPVIKFDFEFLVDYKPNFAELLFKGYVIMIVEKDDAKDILKKWKSKKVSDEIRLPLFNLILTKCNLRALQLEEELNLPTHIPLPRIKPQQDNANYTG
jgi:hypothetical protein